MSVEGACIATVSFGFESQLSELFGRSLRLPASRCGCEVLWVEGRNAVIGPLFRTTATCLERGESGGGNANQQIPDSLRQLLPHLEPFACPTSGLATLPRIIADILQYLKVTKHEETVSFQIFLWPTFCLNAKINEEF